MHRLMMGGPVANEQQFLKMLFHGRATFAQIVRPERESPVRGRDPDRRQIARSDETAPEPEAEFDDDLAVDLGSAVVAGCSPSRLVEVDASLESDIEDPGTITGWHPRNWVHPYRRGFVFGEDRCGWASGRHGPSYPFTGIAAFALWKNYGPVDIRR